MYHATRGKSVWGNGSGGEYSVTSKSFKYDAITDGPDAPTNETRYVKMTEVTYKGDTYTLNFN